MAKEKVLKLVFAITKDELLDYVIRAYGVEELSNGTFGYLAKKITSQNYHTFFDELKPEVSEIISHTDKICIEAIEKIYGNAIYDKNKWAELFKKTIRPYIEKENAKIIQACIDNDIPLYFRPNEKVPVEEKAIRIEYNAKPHFSFLLGKEGISYSLTLTDSEGKNLNIRNNNSFIVSNTPCWLYIDNVLYTFPEEFDGKKLTPFFQKERVSIPQSYTDEYFSKFIVKMVQHFEVDAEGFSIITEKVIPQAILTLTTDLSGLPALSLSFLYKSQKVNPADTSINISELTQKGKEYKITRIPRDFAFEKEKIQKLNQLGIKEKNDFLFRIEPEESTTPIVSLIRFINEHYLELSEHFVIEQETKERYYTGQFRLDSEIHKEIDWFDIRMTLVVGDFKIPFHKLKNNILKNNPDYQLPDGSFFILPAEWFAKYKELFQFAEVSGEKIRVGKAHFSMIDSLFEENKAMRPKDKPKLKPSGKKKALKG